MVNFCGLIPGLIQIIRTIDLTNKYIQARDKYIHTINLNFILKLSFLTINFSVILICSLYGC